MSSHFARASGSEIRAFRKSAGTLCTAPDEIAVLLMDFILHRCAIEPGEHPDSDSLAWRKFFSRTNVRNLNCQKFVLRAIRSEEQLTDQPWSPD